MTRRRTAAVILASLVVSAVGVWFVVDYAVGQSRMTELLGGSANVGVVRNADEVRAYRIKTHGPGRIDYDKLAGPVALNFAQRTQMSRLFTSGSSYAWSLAKGCSPNYGVMLEFQHGDRVVTVYLCLQCRELQFQSDAVSFAIEDFDDIADEVVKLARELFPDDDALKHPYLQSL